METAASIAAPAGPASATTSPFSSKSLDVNPKSLSLQRNSVSGCPRLRTREGRIPREHRAAAQSQGRIQENSVPNCSAAVSSILPRKWMMLSGSASGSISSACEKSRFAPAVDRRENFGPLKALRFAGVCCASSVPASEGAKESVSDSEFSTREGEGEGRGSTKLSTDDEREVDPKKGKPLRASWSAKDSEGKDYLYRLGQEAANMNTAVGARSGMIDDIFIGNFLGKDSDIVFDYRQKVTRSFQNIQGDFYIAPQFLDIVVTHITKNFLASQMDAKVPLILGIWGGKGQGKSFQLELICKALGMEPIIMSAGELESEWAGEPGKLIRQRYRTASQVVKVQGKMSALIINDLDAGVGRFENTQCTVNNQMVVGSLMNLADNPTRVSIGQLYREDDIVTRVPIIVTGNDLSKIWAPLIRDGRMDKFYWHPTREDIVNIVHHMYRNDGLSWDVVGQIVDKFPNQALDFYGALRSRTYDREVLKWIDKIGGVEKFASTLVSKNKNDTLPAFQAPEVSIERLLEAGDSLVQEQRMVRKMRLSDEYMKKMRGPGLSLLAS